MRTCLSAGQAEANAIAGLRLGNANRQYDFEIPVAQNNRMVDICPDQYVGITIVEGDTARGIGFSGRMVPRHVDMNYDMKSGFLWFTWSGEQETFAENAVNGDVPLGDELPGLPPLPSLPPLPPIEPYPGPSEVTDDPKVVVVCVSATGSLYDQAGGIWYTKNFDADAPQWFSWNAGLSAAERGNIVNFDVSEASGRGWLQVYRLSGSCKLYTSPGPGQPWVEALTAAQVVVLLGNHPGSWGEIAGFGIVPGAADEVAAMIIAKWGSMGSDGGWALGGSSGFALTSRYNPIHGYVDWAAVRYSADHWLAHDANFHEIMDVANRGGGVDGQITIKSEAAGPYQYMKMVKAGPESKVALLSWYHLSNDYYLKLTQDNGLTYTDLAVPDDGKPYPIGYSGTGIYLRDDLYFHESMALDPTGQFILLGDQGGLLLKKSSDYGASWGNCPGTYNASAIHNLGDEQNWIISSAGRIFITHDFGATNEEKTGDLWTWTSTYTRIRAIRHLSNRFA